MKPLYAALVVAALIILAPALVIGGGFIVAGVLIVALVVAVIASKLGFEVFKERQSGMSAAKAQRQGSPDDGSGKSWGDR